MLTLSTSGAKTLTLTLAIILACALAGDARPYVNDNTARAVPLTRGVH